MKKVVISKRYGGFGLSPAAFKEYMLREKGVYIFPYGESENSNGEYIYKQLTTDEEIEKKWCVFWSLLNSPELTTEELNSTLISEYLVDRESPVLVSIVEEMGEAANGQFAKLTIVEIPDDVEYTIEDYDGWESIEEVHRSWS